MSIRTATTFALASFLALSATACSSGENPDSGTPMDSGTTDTGGSMDTGGGSDVQQDTGTTADATDTTTPTDVPTDTGSSSGGHLLITEIVTQPGNAESVEIYNPTSAAIDLSDYYLSDNSTYTSIAMGSAWNPTTSNPGTDFLARFPAGASIPAGGVIVIATSPMFPVAFARCPDFILAATDLTCPGAGTARAMVAPTNGDLGTAPGSMLSNDREMLILFRWSGNTAENLQDVDYVTWGTMFEDGTRVDKTGVGSYLPDTAPAMQHPAPAASTNGQSIERCGIDTGERTTGGNGIDGHDETSEQLDMSFRVQTTLTPGVRNSCLP